IAIAVIVCVVPELTGVHNEAALAFEARASMNPMGTTKRAIRRIDYLHIDLARRPPRPTLELLCVESSLYRTGDTKNVTGPGSTRSSRTRCDRRWSARAPSREGRARDARRGPLGAARQ